MKVFVRMAVLSASILGLAACASTEEKTSYVPEHKVQATRVQNDEVYMARVEALARRRGVDLTWVHPPNNIVAENDD